jgi:hypothetical protein
MTRPVLEVLSLQARVQRCCRHRSLAPMGRVDLRPAPGRGSDPEPGEGFGNDRQGACAS